jgi:long-chain acyl-CoA synthetase
MNVGALLSNARLSHGGRPAVRFGDRRLSYDELQSLANRFASGLLARGVEPGDRVALFMRNNAECVIAMFGTFKAGAVVVPVNAKLSAGELAFIVADSAARVLVFGADKLALVEQACAEVPVELLVRVGAGGGPGIDFEQLLAEGSADGCDAEVEPTAPAWLFYTSGTTGRPKGARLSHRNLLAMTMNQLADLVDVRPDDVVFHAAPLSHGSGLYLLGSIARGAENLIYDRASFDPDDVLRLIEREQVTIVMFLAPTMIVMLLRADPAIDTSSLRCVVYGGAPIHAEHARLMLARFGPVFAQIYGQGESPMTITYLPREAHDPDDLEGLASAGFRHVDVEVELRDESGRPVAVGAEGEVCVRGDVVMDGYWRNPEATEQALRGGWLHTGDIGRFDAQGRLFLLDRTNDMIISGGSNIYPREVEEVLVRHDAVSEAAVFGVPDELWGERVVAAVVAAPGGAPGPEELIEFCRQHLASFKKPTEVSFVGVLPKNAYGKVLRRELRQRFQAGPAGSVDSPSQTREEQQ